MAWGVWNKIKQGFKKAGSIAKDVGKGFRKTIDFVNDKVVQPFKPLIGAAAKAINPKAGMIADATMGAVETLSDGLDSFDNWKANSFKPFKRLIR